ncbi:MAG: hypothetical protein QW666_01175 [Candidatus Woesearchaeota archaeon]
MVELVLSPNWFLKKEIWMCIFSVLTLLLIAAFSLRFYFFKKQDNQNYLYFGLSFLIIAISFLSKIVTNFSLSYSTEITKTFGFLTITYKTVRVSNILFLAGHYAHYLLLLIGLYILYLILNKKSTMNHILILYLIIIATVFSRYAHFVSHLTALILLGMIAYIYYRKCRENRNQITKLLFVSFTIWAASQAIFIFAYYHGTIYVVSQIIQLVGFVLLLIAFILVLKNGKKKQNRHHK